MPVSEKEILDLVIKAKECKDETEKELLESSLLEINYDLILRAVESVATAEIDSEDLIQEGFIAFISAIDSFDLNKDIKFSKYAESIIQNKIKKVIKENEESLNVSDEIAETLNKIVDAENKLEASLGRTPNEDEVAFELGISIEDYQNYKAYAARILDDECLKNEPTIARMIEHVSHHEAHIEEDENIDIKESLDLLEEREREILKRFYGIEMEKMRVEEISNEFLLSTDRVKEIVENATNKIKSHIGEN